ncbi:hypothetical protein ACFQ9X_30300 [Catenulispora yoronensis]
MTGSAWHVFTGSGEPHDGWARVPDPMLARTFDGGGRTVPPVAVNGADGPEWARRLGEEHSTSARTNCATGTLTW